MQDAYEAPSQRSSSKPPRPGSSGSTSSPTARQHRASPLSDSLLDISEAEGAALTPCGSPLHPAASRPLNFRPNAINAAANERLRNARPPGAHRTPNAECMRWFNRTGVAVDLFMQWQVKFEHN